MTSTALPAAAVRPAAEGAACSNRGVRAERSRFRHAQNADRKPSAINMNKMNREMQSADRAGRRRRSPSLHAGNVESRRRLRQRVPFGGCHAALRASSRPARSYLVSEHRPTCCVPSRCMFTGTALLPRRLRWCSHLTWFSQKTQLWRRPHQLEPLLPLSAAARRSTARRLPWGLALPSCWRRQRGWRGQCSAGRRSHTRA